MRERSLLICRRAERLLFTSLMELYIAATGIQRDRAARRQWRRREIEGIRPPLAVAHYYERIGAARLQHAGNHR